jgi:CRISPR-associated endonuclease/helicase Cas3
MHVIFISMCEKSAIKKTRRILDSFANRVGNTAWATPINKESLDTIRSALKRSATRQTAVACYKNEGMMRMKLVWTVGNKSTFGKNGEIAIATKTHQSSLPSVPWLNIACSVAKASGLGHDIGKATQDFQNKINPDINSVSQSDPVRHELVSTAIVHKMLNGKQWSNAWDDLLGVELCKNEYRPADKKAMPDFVSFIQSGIASYRDSVLFCIATHHKLFFSNKKDNTKILNMDSHINGTGAVINVVVSERGSSDVMKIAEHLAKYILRKELEVKPVVSSPDFWYGISILTRAALILADHKVSARTPNEMTGAAFKKRNEAAINAECFANTIDGDYNQPLSYHLEHVSIEAASTLRNMALFDPPGLSEDTIEKITSRSEGRFEWQNLAANALSPNIPAIVFNVASTGSGKTIMNSRAAAVLAGEKPLRLSIVLNLRSLTLQTGDSYKEDLGVGFDELSVITGSSVTRKLHDYEKADELSCKNQSDEVEDYEEDLAEDFQYEVPAWINGNCKNNAQKAIVMAPMLVSTIDYLIFAGDPGKQAKHSFALLRLMHSDLIIDEIDGYEPKPLMAVLRLIKISAIFGRNVIVSSATLPKLIAEQVFNSYKAGFAVYKAMNGYQNDYNAVVIDDTIAPQNIKPADNFSAVYEHHIAKMMMQVCSGRVTKKAEIIRFEKTEGGLFLAINQSIETLHGRHAWRSPEEDGFNISVGLIRVANIKNAAKLANKIKNISGVKVCCYHSRHFVIQRHTIERSLNKLLNRKNKENPNKNILESDEIRRIINEHKAAGLKDLKIIIVATPVEEVGRDHDFDWAIIDPSSAQSLVQTAGRVNRHRLVEVFQANIGILQFNFKEIMDGKENSCCFIQPGYEEKKGRGVSTHPCHNLTNLLDEASIGERFDADVRFCTRNHHLLSEYDNNAIQATLDEHVDHIKSNISPEWIGKGIYEKTPLRDGDDQKTIYYDPEEKKWYEPVFDKNGAQTVKEMPSDFCTISKCSSGLFTKSIDDLRIEADEMGIAIKDAFSVSIPIYLKTDPDTGCPIKTTGDKKYLLNRFGCY